MRIRVACWLLAGLILTSPAQAEENPSTKVATTAINSLGLKLLRDPSSTGRNDVFSPYSIQAVLAMTYAGAGGVTQAEMARALAFPRNENVLHASFAALIGTIDEFSKEHEARPSPNGVLSTFPTPFLTLTTANRLFVQQGTGYLSAFLALLSDQYHSPFTPVDFKNAPTETIKIINDWVALQTKDKFTNLLSPGSVQSVVRMILVNAIYLKATWQHRFEPATARPFHLPEGTTVAVPTMSKMAVYGFKTHNHYDVLTIQYTVPDIHFLILLPNEGQSLSAIESRLKPQALAKLSRTPYMAIQLFLPKFIIDPPNLELSGVLTKLGMKSAFNFRTANFGRMNPTLPLFVSSIHHKATLTVDEEGTEATAATWGVIGKRAALEPIKEIHVDRPFLFAIQHRSSGACLFLGRVVDPRPKTAP